jgi:DNA-directed RNA polymerase subunit RPC12/RpoP
MPHQQCSRCDYEWTSVLDSPAKCPRCRSSYWNKPRKYKLKARPDAVPVAPRRPGRWLATEPDKRHGVALADLLDVLKECAAELPERRREFRALEQIARAAFRSPPESP